VQNLPVNQTTSSDDVDVSLVINFVLCTTHSMAIVAFNSSFVVMRHVTLMYTVSQKNCTNFFLSELRQISTNFGNFWQNDGKEAKIMRDALNFHLT